MLKLYDTKTRRIKEVRPQEPGVVKMYTCGPTVYRDAHIGNLRSYLMADWIRRVLEYQGVHVTAIKNITDVGHMRQEFLEQGDDKVVAAAIAEGKSPQEIAEFYTDRFLLDESKLNIQRASAFPRATKHVDEMIEIIDRLIRRGHAYEVDGNVYFSVESFPNYGSLSGNIRDADLRDGERVEADPLKHDPRDFTLWKAAEFGRNLKWPSPWGEGFPGWHIECSAMSMKYLGDYFDIHTGGIDNVFPHHEDEVAQSEGFTGRPVVGTWVHGQHLIADGVKMSKSMQNSFLLGDLEERGIDPVAFRYLCLTARYSARLNFTFSSLRSANRALQRIRNIIRNLRMIKLTPSKSNVPNGHPGNLNAVAGFNSKKDDSRIVSGRITESPKDGIIDSELIETRDRIGRRGSDPGTLESGNVVYLKQEWMTKFEDSINDNLDMPGALGLTWQMLRSDLSEATKLEVALEFDKVLGLGFESLMAEEEAPSQANMLLSRREVCRRKGEFEEADLLRDQIVSKGYFVEDIRSVECKGSFAEMGTRVRAKAYWEKREGTYHTISSSAEVESFLEQDHDVDFTIGIVALNYPEDVKRCLHAAFRWGCNLSVEAVVVDNGSTVGTTLWLDEMVAKDGRIRVIHTDHVLAAAAAYNIILKQSRGKTVILIDPSVEVEGDIFTPIGAVLEDGTVGVIGPWGLRTDDLHHFHDGEYETGDMDAMQSYLFAFHRSRVMDVGLMRETFRFYRNLDIDYSFHFKDRGLRILADPSLPVRRHEHRGWDELPKTERDALSRKNYGRFLHKWGERVDLLVGVPGGSDSVK